MEVNRQILWIGQPAGMPKESDFRLVESEVPRPRPGEVLVRSLFLSVEPNVRGRSRPHACYSRGMEMGEVMAGGIVGRVIESNDPRVASGEVVEGMLGWQDYATAPAKALRRIDPAVAPISTALSVLGIPGLTAYFGLLEICRPQPGETVVVSAAAGAIGSLVGQIARIKRCRAVGIAGSDEKVRLLTDELGFDAGFNCNQTQPYSGKLKELCPTGIDVYFDNVGGPLTDAIIGFLNTRARVAICDQLSLYISVQPEMGPRWLDQLLLKQAKVEGFLVSQWSDRYGEGLRQLTAWLREGRLKYREDIVEGLQNAPRAFIRTLEGENTGKQLVKVAE
jgi:NADPH:quinone reductase